MQGHRCHWTKDCGSTKWFTWANFVFKSHLSTQQLEWVPCPSWFKSHLEVPREARCATSAATGHSCRLGITCLHVFLPSTMAASSKKTLSLEKPSVLSSSTHPHVLHSDSSTAAETPGAMTSTQLWLLSMYLFGSPQYQGQTLPEVPQSTYTEVDIAHTAPNQGVVCK